MYLKRLEIQGFKSFANKTVLEFEKGMTAVVGPNGSGKSNVADAIRWVLGEQSLKQLRGKKAEDVIFAGSEKKQRMSFAQVSVTFDNRDRKIPVDYSEVSITRSVDRNGDSEYLINGNRVRLLDIVDLILKSNIGTSRHTVIGQGTIDQMILSGPGEIKNLIDEASGVKTYYIRKEKTLKRLEQTVQNLTRVNDLLSEIEPRLKSLRRQAKRMEERAGIEETLKQLQAEFYSQKLLQVRSVLSEFQNHLSGFDSQRLALESEIAIHRDLLDRSEQSDRGEVQRYQEVRDQIRHLTERKNKLVEDSAMIRGKLSAQSTVGDTQSLELEKRNLENSKAQLVSEIEGAQSALGLLEDESSQQRSVLEQITHKLADIQKSLENPEGIDFQELASEVQYITESFEKLYSETESADPGSIRGFLERFRSQLHNFRQKALHFTQNPFQNFERQKKNLAESLALKDRITEELNNLELRKSKISINLQYLQTELQKTEQKLLNVDLDLQKSSAQDVDQFFEELLSQEKKVNNDISAIASEIAELESSIREYHDREQNHKRQMIEEERQYRIKNDKLSELKDRLSAIQIEKAKIETQFEGVMAEARQALGLQLLQKIQENPVESITSGLEEKISRLKHQLDMIGGIDEMTLQEYQETEQRYTYLNSQVEDLQKGIDDLKSVLEELDTHIKKRFKDSFDSINQQFENYFRILFNGGRAYLSPVKPTKHQPQTEGEALEAEAQEVVKEAAVGTQDALEAAGYDQTEDIIGIDIKATPPGKKLASISALSGGERSLTSIALLCALLSCFPSPFVMLDEVDAALDEANTIRFAQILGTLASQTQFITVTHNRETMRQAHTLYGVTMGDDSISKVLSLKIEQAEGYAK